MASSSIASISGSSAPLWMVEANTSSLIISVSVKPLEWKPVSAGISHSIASTVTLSDESPAVFKAISTSFGTASATGIAASVLTIRSSSRLPHRPSEHSSSLSPSARRTGPATSNIGRTVEPRQVNSTLRLTPSSDAPALACASRYE